MHKKINNKDLILFHQQIALLLQAKLPLLLALSTFLHSSQHPTLKKILKKIIQHIEAGYAYSDALKQYPAYFQLWICELIRIGEQSGSLTETLQKLTAYLTERAQLIKQCQESMRYPILLFSLFLLSLFLFSYFILPEFSTLFNQFHASLPWITQQLLFLAPKIPSMLFIFIIIFFLLQRSLYFFYQTFPSFAYQWDSFILKLPIIRLFFKLSMGIRFTQTLKITLSAGLPLFESLRLIMLGDPRELYRQTLFNLTVLIRQGMSLDQALMKSSCFPSIIQEWIHLGEESGQLEIILDQLNLYLTEQLKHHQRLLIQCLEPFLIFCIGFGLSIFMIGMYLPMMQLGELF